MRDQDLPPVHDNDQADAMSNDTLPGDPTHPHTTETQPLGSPEADDTTPARDEVADDAKSPGGNGKKRFNPWRFEAITLSPEVRRELIQMERPRIPEEQLYHLESATASKSPSQGEAADASLDALGEDAERRADTLLNLRAVAPVSFVRPAFSPILKVVLIGLAVGALLTVGSYLMSAPAALPPVRPPRDSKVLSSQPAPMLPPAKVGAPAALPTGRGPLTAPLPTTAPSAALQPKTEASARSAKKPDDRSRPPADGTRSRAPAESRAPAASPAPSAQTQDNGNWFKIRD